MRIDRYIYRGKTRAPKNEWIQGSLKVWIDASMSIITPAACLSVQDDTVGQCTGFKDINGKLIFEGDIVRWQDSDGVTRHNTVEWTPNCCLSLCNSSYSIGAYAGYSLEVIGNIWDNPELKEFTK